MSLRGAWATWAYLPRLFPYLRPYRRLLAISVVVTVVAALIGLAAPWPLAFMVDSVLANHPVPGALEQLIGHRSRTGLLIFAAACGLGLTVVGNALTVLLEYVNTKFEQRLVLDFRGELFQHAQRLSVAYHDDAMTGQLMSQINYEAEAAGSLIMSLLPLAQSALTLIGMFYVAFLIDHVVALLSLVVVPFIYYSVGMYSARIVPRLQFVRGLEWGAFSIIFEAMSMQRVIAAFGREHHEFRRFRTQGETAVDQRVKLTVRQTLFSLGVNTFTAAGTALVLAVGALHVIHHQLTVGDLLVVLGYIAAVYSPLEMISSTVGGLQQQLVMIQGAFMLLDTEPEVKDDPDAIELGRARGRVSFNAVRFTYRGRHETLREVSFEAEPGARIAIIGPTGAGKTTLMSLLMRFHDPQGGSVLLDGVDVRKIKLRSLRDQVSVVLQEPLLFSGSICENIRYGRLDAGLEEIVAAARAANADEFISQLPDGYQTELGEGGARLSGGERQRICVARAFLKDAPILVLDEPTSSVDSRTEAVILDALDKLAAGRTTFTIAHRLSTVRHADLVLVLDNGALVESGTHRELRLRGGLYDELHDAQLREPEPARVRAGDDHALRPSALRELVTFAPAAAGEAGA